jgi:diguanylate cyclase (GGDEF)-like protein/PAS domain S-box-containing protein
VVNPLPRNKDYDEFHPMTADGRGESDVVLPLPSRWRLTSWLWSLLALLSGLALTVFIHHQQQQRLQVERTLIRDELANKALASLQGRLQAAESLLRAAQSLFLSSEEVDEGEYAGFYANMHPREQFPSLLALAYAKRELRPDGEHYISRWVRPLAGNEGVIGLDVATQPNNFASLLASRDSDRATLSAPFRLVQLAGSDTAGEGITLRLPIYSSGPPPQTTAERRSRMRGSVAASFRLDGLIGEALPERLARNLRLRVSDVSAPQAVLLFDSDSGPWRAGDGYRYENRFTYGGRTWSVEVRSLPQRAPRLIGSGGGILLAGVLASVLLALLVYSVASTRQRALVQGWRMSRRYRESEKRFRALNDLLPALVLLAEAADGTITYANQAARDRLGLNVTERRLPELFGDPELRTQLQRDDTRGCGRIDALLRSDVGGGFWASVAISRVALSGRSKLLMVASDISEQRQLTELLSHQASHDALTELYNRREFEHRLHRALDATLAGAPLAVLLYIDLDQFKLINDTSGHLAGDQLLAQLAIVMRKQLGGTDMLARLGGDEFGVLVSGVADRADAERLAERMRRCIDGYVFIWEQRSYMISASIGGVMIDRPGILVKDLLAQADTACYMAKELGRNRVHFYSERDDQTARRHSEMEWANRLRWAIDEHRLVLTYQEIWPLPLTAGGEPDIEVLLRFREESGQLVVPGVFMPAAERYGLMPVVDRWVIEAALANFDRLHPAGGALRMVAINLSGASVEDEELAGRIIELLRRYRVEPSRVCFEITETVAVRNLSPVVRFMEQLRAVGCRIALDDFGAGMSSFTYLKNLPLDIIKIDGSFVRDMLTDPVSHLMVRAVTDIGHRLGLEVVAEWVADAETVRALAALGVNRVQGFSLHRPEPALFQRD